MRFFLLILFLFSLSIARLDRYFFKANDSFCLSRVQYKPGVFSPWESSDTSSIKSILDQPFTYLTKGKQSFVFLSQDGRHVLKLFRFPSFVRIFSWDRPTAYSLRKFQMGLQGYRHAYEDLKQETQILSASLGATNYPVILTDRLGVIHRVNLKNTAWLLQKKATSFLDAFDEADEATARKMIDKTFAIYTALYQKGYIDHDAMLERNFGIAGGTPILLDVGQLEKCNDLGPLRDYLLNMTISLRAKLETSSPHLLEAYFETLNFHCNQISAN